MEIDKLRRERVGEQGHTAHGLFTVFREHTAVKVETAPEDYINIVHTLSFKALAQSRVCTNISY